MKKLKDYLNVPDATFQAYWWEDGVLQEQEFTFDLVIGDNDFEWLFAVSELANELNTLGLGETIPFQGNRDNENTKGFIVRID